MKINELSIERFTKWDYPVDYILSGDSFKASANNLFESNQLEKKTVEFVAKCRYKSNILKVSNFE